MAQNSQSNKPKWKVGSFLQQAVAGVESRLDQILAEEEDQKQVQAKNAATKPKPTEQTGNLSRSSSNARKNDRLQERLARAMVKNSPGPLATQGSSRTSSPVTSPVPSNGTRSSMDIDSSLRSSSVNPGRHSRSSSQVEDASVAAESRNSYDSGPPRESNDTSRLSTESALPPHALAENDDNVAQSPTLEEAQSSADGSKLSAPTVSVSSMEPAEETSNGLSNGQERPVHKLQPEAETAESQRQEEIYGYIERIDALQSKLKYLAKEAAESAKQAATAAEPGSVERQLREKDEKIALLLEEGQKLSRTEMDHRTAIKKLRQQLMDNAKAQTEVKKKTEKLERDLASAETRAKRAEAAEKRANDSLSIQTKTSQDLEAVIAERNALSQTVQEMKGQLARAVARAEAVEAKAQSEALEQEKRRASQLEEDLSSVKIERDISEGKMRREISGLQATIEQERERARMLEVELKGEQSMLEKASTGVAGDTQTQYAGSLLARLANVEKERDEAARRESEMRRKIREMNLKVKRIEEELETAKETGHDLESKLEEATEEIKKLEQKLRKATEDLDLARKDFAEQQKVIDATWTQKLEDERLKLREQMSPPPVFLQQPRTQSPVAYSRRPSALEPIGTLSDYRPSSRRPSALPTSPDMGNLSRQNSFPLSTQSILSPSTATSSIHLPIPETPSINFEHDELFSRSATPSAYGGAPTQHSRGINDIISESTVGAGPSVQLVERMSATVRRLESERAASKDELSRITAQRDEARQQVVDLMREVETKRTSDTRVHELEQRLDELDQRYQTTLEMLGEKSEQVEELEADIADLKKIYRELVDSTMK
ncbi:M protein repeat protein [Aspergillus aculeatinus CBS 121060]|uniref:M protein repeat protein n=1 Tax=Aspergillus aculeatinus CBS 121060 TaxID=1448322 RepID=A0ACD1GXR5_9EURO|nr:M protein repeat protein [Aspergillus aculeatinus CBS 121060]RAH66129.1 M protein repeat protein [Aspergillus aculeatinus CBS 121060]